MKKAVVVGGSNGLGLAISVLLMDKGYFVEICDRCPPQDNVIKSSNFNYNYCDLLDFDESLFSSFASDYDVEILMITAGVGRVADFRYFHVAEVKKILTINTLAAVSIFNIFYQRIYSNLSFYSGVISSISGWLSSPLAAVYSASKAAVSRFVESVNIELEVSGVSNRILDVSPSYFKGSRFYGLENDINSLLPLADSVVVHLLSNSSIFIPDYNKIFKKVISSYHDNPHDFGVNSYNYKIHSGRVDNLPRVKIGYLSGTFDLFHVGHLNLLRRAKSCCDYLVVGVHESGKWKGKDTFIPFNERKAIVSSCKYVDKVIDSCREDCDVWEVVRYNYLFVGSDYKGSPRFQKYEKFFSDKNVRIVYFPYTTSTSSTQIRNLILNFER